MYSSTTVIAGRGHDQDAPLHGPLQHLRQVGFGFACHRFLPGADVDDRNVALERERNGAGKIELRNRPHLPVGRLAKEYRQDKTGAARGDAAYWIAGSEIMLQMPVACASGAPQSGGTMGCNTSIDASQRTGCDRSGRPSTTPMVISADPGPASARAARMPGKPIRMGCSIIIFNHRGNGLAGLVSCHTKYPGRFSRSG